MGGKSYVYGPDHYAWLNQHPQPWSAARLWDDARASFPGTWTSFEQFRGFVRRAKSGTVYNPRNGVPLSPVEDLSELIVERPWKVAFVSSDYQIPYHDHRMVELMLELADAYQVKKHGGHVINGDLGDMSAAGRYPALIHGNRLPLGKELELIASMLNVTIEVMGSTVFVMGNHDLRLLINVLNAELLPEQSGDLLTTGVTLRNQARLEVAQLRWMLLTGYPEEPIRVTHPMSASINPGMVGRRLAANHECHMIVAHDHKISMARSMSGRWTVIHSGGMFDHRRLAYSYMVDSTQPAANQGFVVVHPNESGDRPVLRLIDPRNLNLKAERAYARAVT